MSHNGEANTNHIMAVISQVEEWSSLKSLLQTSCQDEGHQVTCSSLGAYQVCSVTVEDEMISLHYADLKEDMSDESICQAVETCIKPCTNGISSFLLLIQGGCYTKKERRLVEILQAHFGPEILKYLVILSTEDGEVVDTLDDALLDLINVCDGRYCRITSSSVTGGLHSLLEMVNCTLSESGVGGYTEAMLAEAKRRCTEDSAMKLLKQKVEEAENKEQEFKDFVQMQENRRTKEMEELKAKHAGERKKEAAERKKYEEKREGLQEAVISHKASLQLQMTTPSDDETKAASVILLGLSGSGKSSALNLILSRAGNQYSLNGSTHEPTHPTLSCEKKVVFAADRRLILVDTPELWDEDGVENLALVKDCLALALPGPHVFLLVLQVGRFTQGENNMLGYMQKTFGREVAEHSIILFINSEENQSKPQRVDDYVAEAHTTLQDLIRKCGSRFHGLNITNNRSALSYPQVRELLLGINKLVASHGGRPFLTKRFSPQELQERNKVIVEKKEDMLEINHLLRGE
ncbi:GTPase IMAP family member 7 [Oryzias melastigma]|uniref:GTPase IMAP family member 7 n=1 Tax=Oryzias melastigma TaxID=30732 RepID=A0A834F220_ORYME|nr:GTPase IMAP family member 7 [Oryzias melastigma]